LPINVVVDNMDTPMMSREQWIELTSDRRSEQIDNCHVY